MGKKSDSISSVFNDVPSIKDYFLMQDKDKGYIDFIIKNALKPNSILRINKMELQPKKNDFWDLSWGDLIELRELVKEKNISKVIEILYQVKEFNFYKLEVFNCFSVYKWVVEQLNEISKIEAQELSSEPTIEEIEAGVEMLNEFGYTVSIDILANGNILEYDRILSKPYHVIFKKLCLNKTKNEIQKNYIDNVSRKNKRNS